MAIMEVKQKRSILQDPRGPCLDLQDAEREPSGRPLRQRDFATVIRTAASNAESHGKGKDDDMESGIIQSSPTVMMMTIKSDKRTASRLYAYQ